jgi:hypothetical protein
MSIPVLKPTRTPCTMAVIWTCGVPRIVPCMGISIGEENNCLSPITQIDNEGFTVRVPMNADNGSDDLGLYSAVSGRLAIPPKRWGWAGSAYKFMLTRL